VEESRERRSNPNTGHRERLRRRFKDHGLENFQDYEALELLLLYVARQQDMKPIARRLIERFGSFQAVLDGTAIDLMEVDGIGDASVTLIHFVKQAASRYLSQKSFVNLTPEDITGLVNSCRLKMGALPNEQFRLFSLNANFVVIGEDIIAEGTIDQAAVYPRIVIEKALKHGATTLIFVHNHPTGDVMPSDMDKTITRGLILAARAVGVNVFDHIIVSSWTHFSFRESSLL